MLALKFAHELHWGDLRFIEDPMHAIRTVQIEHGNKVAGKFIRNAHQHDLPTNKGTRFDPYGNIKTQLENGQAFLINHFTPAPAITFLDIDDDGKPEYRFRSSVNTFFKSAFGSALRHIPIPKPMGVLRDEPKPAQEKQEQVKAEREKHVILLELEGQNDRPLPLKHNVTLYVENTTQGGTAARQLTEVIYNPFSKVFSTEKGDSLKVYVIPHASKALRDDLNHNKNVKQSEADGLIKPLDETGQETRADGVILHHFKYEVPNNYIEIELLDEDDQPQAGMRYQVLNQYGQIIANDKLDENGYAILEGVDASEAEVFFPTLDNSFLVEV